MRKLKLGTPLIVIAALFGTALLLAGGGFVWLFAVHPRLVLRRFDAFVSHHPVGSDVADLVDDPFVDDITMAQSGSMSIDFRNHGALATLRADVKSQTAGHVMLEWTHTPPFGRISISADFSGGRITSIRQAELD
jgi:hypothetical protein